MKPSGSVHETLADPFLKFARGISYEKCVAQSL